MDIRTLIRGHRMATVSMAVASTLGGLAEAAFLVVATRLALAVSDGAERAELFLGRSMSMSAGLWLALALLVVRFLLAWFANRIAADMGVAIAAELRRDLSRAFLHASWERQQSDRVGRLQELMTSYATSGSNLVSGFTNGLTAAFGLLALLALAIAVSPVGALVVIAAVAVLALALRPVRERLRRRSLETLDTGMSFATGLGEMAGLGLELQVFGVQDEMAARVDSLIDEGRDSTRRLAVLRGIVPHLYTSLAYVALVGALALASGSDTADVDSLGAVMLVMLRSLSYGQQLQVSAAVVSTMRPYVAELEGEINSYRDAAVRDGGLPVGDVGDIEFRDVGFEYVPGEPVLTGVDVTVGRGEVVGIIGPSGSGKSTLVQLLLGLRSPTSGTVLADGRPVSSLSRAEWVRRVTFVPQTPRLVRGTVADNIRFLRPGVSDAQVEAAARLAHVHDEIVATLEGYARQVGESGGALSGGQQQRVCIARALVEEPQVLVLDEPTSALDGQSEALVRQTLAELGTRMTVVIIAHRMSTLDVCDRLMVVQDGRVVAFDTPERLQADSEFYRQVTGTLA
ncbi:MAG: ABC transporter ATP-binding protein [Actinobacteria bacterium]|nr:ABC transporter ATP-binding protein [Actinomycetota bacterium]